MEFTTKVNEKTLNLNKIDDVLRCAYIIYSTFNKRHCLDVYGDMQHTDPLMTDQNRLDAIDDFDKNFDMKQIIQIDFNTLPEPITVPAMRVRDMKAEV